MTDLSFDYDVLIVGTGNAACAAALAAVERNARVGILEKAPQRDRGGNSSLTGHMRFVYSGIDDLRPLPRMLQEARKLFGTKEVAGSAKNLVILGWAKEVGLAKSFTDDAVSWCGLFMPVVAKRAGKPVELIVAEGFNHFEIRETFANPFGIVGRALLAQMKLSGNGN